MAPISLADRMKWTPRLARLRFIGIFPMIFLGVLTVSAQAQVQTFHPVPKKMFSKKLMQSPPLCEENDEKAWCWERYLEVGKAWAGDVNGDGVEELLIEPGTGGSGGDDMMLYQKVGDTWKQILDSFPYLTRLVILPIVREGYHDLHLDSLHCYKWTGHNYRPYSNSDYRKLQPEHFDTSDPQNAEILWLARYAGLKQFQFEPRWFSFIPQKSSLSESLRDRQEDLIWVAEFKGAVWGVRGKRAFLILPRASHLGSERLELEGDWLVIYGWLDQRVARYNRRTHQLQITVSDTPFWLN